jgi:hypothetical protein
MKLIISSLKPIPYDGLGETVMVAATVGTEVLDLVEPMSIIATC